MSIDIKEGWIAVHRSMRKNPRYKKNSAWVHVWLELLLLATHSQKETIFKGEKITLNPGQLLTGRKAISANTGVSESCVERMLKTLENEQQIKQETSNINRLITILNWNTYQLNGQQNGQRANNQRTTGEQPADTYNNEDNDKESKEEEVELPPPPDGLLSQVKWIKEIRKEFAALRDVDISNALTGCPDEEARKAGMRDFGRDMIATLGPLPPIPTKKLRGYLSLAERERAKTTAPAGGRTPGIENLSAEEVIERASDALARKGI